MLGMALSINEHRIRYDDKCSGQVSCTVKFTPDVTLKSPNLYYEIENFYGNHRNFVKSLSYSQLRGNEDASTSSCDPIEKNKDVSTDLKALDGTKLPENGKANPCGLRAKYIFTDTYTMSKGSTPVPIDETKISHSVDRNSKFQRPDNYRSIQWNDTANEHLMVWFQTDAFPDFIKLWGRIDQDLDAGTEYTIQISNTWPTSEIEAKKYIFLTETNAFGGKNLVFGVLYVVGGSVFFLLSLVMVVLEIIKRKNKTKLKRTSPNLPPI
jgi:hypothetical protein